MKKSKKWTGERLETNIYNETSIEHLHRYALAIELSHNKKILDIASGEGYGSNLLAKGASHVTGVDIDAGVIQEAIEKYKRQNLDFITGTVENIPAADKQFDVVVSFETLEHITNHDRMISEVKRVLRPDGLIIISTPNKKNYSDKHSYKNPFHLKELYPEEFGDLLKKYFKNVLVFSQQIALSSVITIADANGLKIYKGDYDAIRTDNAENPLYCIALASDELLPEISNSLFNGESILAKAISEKENMATKTFTYKFGHTILYPAKMLKRLFKKKKSQE